jgi:hypothetical protein
MGSLCLFCLLCLSAQSTCPSRRPPLHLDNFASFASFACRHSPPARRGALLSIWITSRVVCRGALASMQHWTRGFFCLVCLSGGPPCPSRRPLLHLENFHVMPVEASSPQCNTGLIGVFCLSRGSTFPSRRPLLNSLETPFASVPIDAPVEAPSTRSYTRRILGLGFVEAPSSQRRMGVSSLLPLSLK